MWCSLKIGTCTLGENHHSFPSFPSKGHDTCVLTETRHKYGIVRVVVNGVVGVGFSVGVGFGVSFGVGQCWC